MKISRESFVADMEDCISRKQALKELSNLMSLDGSRDGYDISRFDVEFILKRLPVVYPKKRTASWIYDPNGMDYSLGAWICSECKNKNDTLPTFILKQDGGSVSYDKINPLNWAGSNFCPNCGCRMIDFKTDLLIVSLSE